MEKLTTAKNKTYDCDYFNPSPDQEQINLRVIGVPLVEVAAVFGDPAETVSLTYEVQQADGFTRLLAIIPAGNATRVVLKKE